MSNEDNLSRRKILSTTGGVGSAIFGMSSVAAGKPSGKNGRKKGLTKEEVRKALAEMEIHPAAGSKSGINVQHTEVPDDVDIYVGKYKNAETPTGESFAIESYEEYLDRDAPPGFESTHEQISSMAVEPTGSGTDFFYLQEDVGAITLEGYTFNVGIGTGVKIEGTTAFSLTATLSLDLYIDNVSFALSSFTVGYGISDKGLCLGPFKVNYSVLRGLEVEVCGTAGLTDVGGDDLEVTFGPTLKLCADPCPGFNCAYCKSVSASMSKTFPSPI